MFEFVVTYWDDEEQRMETARGILPANDYVSATKKAHDFCYSPDGSSPINSIYVSELDDILSWDDIKDWVEEKKKTLGLNI